MVASNSDHEITVPFGHETNLSSIRRNSGACRSLKQSLIAGCSFSAASSQKFNFGAEPSVGPWSAAARSPIAETGVPRKIEELLHSVAGKLS